jgi:hypothetical protein
VENNTSVIANLLYANLVSACPVDTGNMKRNIEIKELEDRYIITISHAVNDRGVNYARYVNYDWGNRTEKSQDSYSKRRKNKPQKEKQNYMWVEKTITRTLGSVVGEGSVINEL